MSEEKPEIKETEEEYSVRVRFKGDRRGNGAGKNHDPEYLPKHTPTREKGTYDYDDYHHPDQISKKIKRIINGSVGQVWNDVYSKLIKDFPQENEANRIALNWQIWNVETSCIVEDGMFLNSSHNSIYRDYYVEPDTGILRRATKLWKKKNRDRWNKNKEITHIVHGKRHFFKKEDIWYEVVFEKLPKTDENNDRYGFPICGVTDAILGGWISKRKYIEFYGEEVYAKTKLQLNKKELKKFITPVLEQHKEEK